MKKTIIAAAIVCAAIATPAMANDFTGLRVEVTAGTDLDHVRKGLNPNDITYGGAVGIDAPLGDKLVVGVEATVDNVFNYRDYGASARLGVKVGKSALVYGKVGYADFRGLEGVRVGGGVVVKLTGALYAKVEYRYSDLEKGAGRHQTVVGVGLRF